MEGLLCYEQCSEKVFIYDMNIHLLGLDKCWVIYIAMEEEMSDLLRNRLERLENGYEV